MLTHLYLLQENLEKDISELKKQMKSLKNNTSQVVRKQYVKQLEMHLCCVKTLSVKYHQNRHNFFSVIRNLKLMHQS